MKDKRNCNNNMNYPVYPQPIMTPPIGFPNYPYYNSGVSSNTLEQQLNSLEQQINLLDQRISRLEKAYISPNANMNNYNKYNDSNYYMV